MDRVGQQVTDLVNKRLLVHAEGKSGSFVSFLVFLVRRKGWVHVAKGADSVLIFDYQPDCTQYVIQASRTFRQRSPDRIVQQLVALLFATCHQLPMVKTWTLNKYHSSRVRLI